MRRHRLTAFDVLADWLTLHGLLPEAPFIAPAASPTALGTPGAIAVKLLSTWTDDAARRRRQDVLDVRRFSEAAFHVLPAMETSEPVTIELVTSAPEAPSPPTWPAPTAFGRAFARWRFTSSSSPSLAPST